MLVLQRRKGESLKIGDDIDVKILSIDINSHGFIEVTIGITAPKEINITRHNIKKRKPKNDKT